MESILSRLCQHYKITEEEYERLSMPPSFSNIPFFDEDPIIQKALLRLEKAKERKEKILVYGDYDTDGVMSTSILVRSLREYGIETNGYLPSRYLDGYGLTKDNVIKIADKGYSIIFTCDNGVAAHEALLEAKRRNVEVIILDHHEFDGVELETEIVIHPETINYGNVPISAGYLSFVFSHALLKRIDEYLMCLGAISTISDMMPFKKYNREIIRLMLLKMNKEPLPEILALTDKRRFDESVFQMEIVPKINSIGRIEKGSSINRLIKYFAERNADNNKLIAAWINQVNDLRKTLTGDAENEMDISKSDPAIVVETKLPEGLNGLLASRLLNKYEKPVAVFSEMEKDPTLLVGSLRSSEGFNIIDAMNASHVTFFAKGGHPFAAGCSIKKEDLAAFKKDFCFFALKNKFATKNNDSIDILLSECNMKTYRMIENLSPFGLDWEAPKFLLKDLNPLTFTYIKDGKYLSMKLSDNVKIFSFSLGEDSFEVDKKVSLLLTFKVNEYRGKLSLNLLAERAL